MIYCTQISRAGMVALVATMVGSRVPRDRTVGRSPRDRRPLRSWEASRESLRNFTGKTHRRVTALKCSLPPSVYLSGLSQAPHVMHRRRFPFSAPPMSGRERKLLGKQGAPSFVSALRVAGLGKQRRGKKENRGCPMANNEQVENQDFNELVKRRAGSARKDQEHYLANVVMHLMMKPIEQDARLPDSNVLHAFIAKGSVGKICEKDVSVAMKVLDAFYYMVARAFLDDPDYNPDNIRSKAMEFMRTHKQGDKKVIDLDIDAVEAATLGK